MVTAMVRRVHPTALVRVPSAAELQEQRDRQLTVDIRKWHGEMKQVCDEQRPHVERLWPHLRFIACTDLSEDSIGGMPSQYDGRGYPTQARYHLRFLEDGSVIIADHSSSFGITPDGWKRLCAAAPTECAALERYRGFRPAPITFNLGDITRLERKGVDLYP